MAAAQEYVAPRHKFSPLEKINLFISIYGQMASAIFRPSWWLPFLVSACFQALGLIGLIYYYAPLWIGIIYPILARFLPEQVFHYPQYYLALPSIYSACDSFVLGPTVWLVCLGLAVFILGGGYLGEKRSWRDGLKTVLRSYPQLIIAWLIEILLTVLIMYLPVYYLQRFLIGSPNRILAVNLLLQLAAFGISAMLLYAVPGIILDRKKVGPAIRDSLVLFFHNMFLTYFIVLVPGIIGLVFGVVLGNFSSKIVALLNPGLIPALLFIQIALGIFVNLFIYGAAVYTYREMTSAG